MKLITTCLATGLALAGCGNVVGTTAARLGMISPLDADPARFAIAVDLPDGIGFVPQTAQVLVCA